MQNGSIMRSTRLRGPDVWEFRWREAGADGTRKHRRMVIGSTAQFSDKSSALHEVAALRQKINLNHPHLSPQAVTVSELVNHYRQRELATDHTWKTHSTKVTYQGYLNKWILPRWNNYTLCAINAGEVELWLRSLPLARASCAKIRNLMSVVFNHAIRHQVYSRNPIRWFGRVPNEGRFPWAPIAKLPNWKAFLKYLSLILLVGMASAQHCRKIDIDKSSGFCTVPDPALTPGKMDASLACVSNNDRPRTVTDSEKNAILAAYGYPASTKKSTGEFDHWFPHWMGGADTQENIWFEPHAGKFGSFAKDKVELLLWRKVCVSKSMTLDQAKTAYLKGWTKLLPQH